MDSTPKTLSLYRLKSLADCPGLQLTPEHSSEVLARLIQAETDLQQLATNGRKVAQTLGIIDQDGRVTGKDPMAIMGGFAVKVANPFSRSSVISEFAFLNDLLPLLQRYGNFADEAEELTGTDNQ
jgi:hypothetical protein